MKIDIKRRRRSLQQVRIACRPDELLNELGIEYRDKRGELFALCPNPAHPDTRPTNWHMRCDPGSDMNTLHYCHSCGWSGDVFTLVQTVTGCDFAEAINRVRGLHVERTAGGEVEDVRPADVVYADELYDKETKPWLPPEMERPREVGPIIEGGACWRYLHDRDFGEDEIVYYGLCDMLDSLRLYVPIMFGGRLIGYVARTYVDEEKKVKFPPGEVSGTWGLLGLDRADRSCKVVSLCDGWGDMFRLRQARKPNPIGACGSTLTEEQAWALSWAERFDVYADGDVGGERLIKETVGWFGGGIVGGCSAGRKINVAMMRQGTDPAMKKASMLSTIQPVAYSSYRKRRRQNDG